MQNTPSPQNSQNTNVNSSQQLLNAPLIPNSSLGIPIKQMPPELLKILGLNINMTKEQIHELSKRYDYPEDLINQFINGFFAMLAQHKNIPKTSNLQPLPLQPQILPNPHLLSSNQVQPNLNTQPPVDKVKKPKEEVKEKKKKDEKKVEKVEKEEKKEKKKVEKESSLPKIPKKKERPEFERKMDALLDETGGLNNEKDVSSLIQLMNHENVNYLMIIQTLTKTKVPLLKRFVQINGLNHIKEWLLDPSMMKFMKEIIELLLIMPATVESLKSSGIGKTINKLKRDQFDDVSNIKPIKFFEEEPTIFSDIKESLKKLIEKWTKLIKDKEKKEEKGIFSSISESVESKFKYFNNLEKRETIKQIPVEQTSKSNQVKEPSQDKKRPLEVNPIIKTEEKPLKKQLKKKLTWAPEEKLHRYHTYTTEIEIEVKNSRNAYENERNNEKRLLQERKDQLKYKLSHMIPTTQWITPQFSGFDIDRGYESEEVHIQDKRCLQEEPKYFLSHQIPESPSSPPPEIAEEDQGNILHKLTQNPHLLSQLLGMIQTPQVQQQPTYQTQNSYQIPTTYPPYQSTYLPTPSIQQTIPYINTVMSPPQLTDLNSQKSKTVKCKFFNTNVGCRNGNNCPFYHG